MFLSLVYKKNYPSAGRVKLLALKANINVCFSGPTEGTANRISRFGGNLKFCPQWPIMWLAVVIIQKWHPSETHHLLRARIIPFNTEIELAMCNK